LLREAPSKEPIARRWTPLIGAAFGATYTSKSRGRGTLVGVVVRHAYWA